MKKCDFCSYSDPNGKCGWYAGCPACADAVKLYTRYLSQQNSNRNVRTKNVNVNVKKRKY